MIQLTAACGGALCFKYTKKTPPTLIVNSFFKITLCTTTVVNPGESTH